MTLVARQRCRDRASEGRLRCLCRQRRDDLISGDDELGENPSERLCAGSQVVGVESHGLRKRSKALDLMGWKQAMTGK